MPHPVPALALLLALVALIPPVTADSADTDAAAVAGILSRAPDDGLPGIAEGQDAAAPSLRAAALSYASAQYGGRLKPSQINPEWGIAPAIPDLEVGYEAARSAGRLAPWLADAAPADPRYAALLAQRRLYAGFAAAGGWPPLTLNDASSPEPLRRRLAAEGYGVSGAEAEAVKAALTLFQRRHSLTASGKMDAKTLAALNVSAADRLDQIDANLERWRWAPHRLPADRIEVDIAGARLTAFQAGQAALRMKIIVGTPQHHTPMFISAVRTIVLNPPWIVPDSIARNELYPIERAHPGSLKAAGIIDMGGRLMQPPGPRNPLGRIKFDFDSPFGVYLHDTSAKGLFANRPRLFSHGCMRVEKPRELALMLLEPQGWSMAAIDGAIARGATRRVGLETQTPLFVFYWTASVGADGAARFRPDVYGWDAQLLTALRRVRVDPRPAA